MFKTGQHIELKNGGGAEIIKVSKTSITFKLTSDFEIYSTGEILTIKKQFIYKYIKV